MPKSDGSDQLEAFVVYATVMRLCSVMDDESRLFGPMMAGTINMEGEFYSEVLDFERGVTQPPG